MSTAIYDAKMTLETSGFNAAMAKARESSEKALSVIKTVGLGVTGLGGAFAAFQGAEAITEGLKNAIEMGRQFAVQARESSQSVATMVQLKVAFQDAGINADGVSTSLFMLNKAMGGVNEEGQPTAAAFGKIGLSLADLKKMNAVQQFQAISAGLARLPDAAARANAAQEIFGRGARDIMAVLNDPKGFNQSVVGAAEYAKTMQQNAGAFEAVGKAVEQVQLKVQEFYAGVASGLAPILEKVLGYINKIDFAKWGRDIGQAVAIITQAFSDGKVTEILKLGLMLAFKEAVNVMYGGIFGLAAAMQVGFRHVPQLLSDAFSMLTNKSFWQGIGELLLGGFLSIQGRLMQMFFKIADALGNRLADVLQHIPGMSVVVKELRDRLNSGNAVMQSDLQKSTAAGDAMAASGAAKIAGASAPLVGDYMKTVLEEIKTAVGAYQANKAFDTNVEARKLVTIIATLAAQVSPGGGDGAATPAPKSGASTAALSLKSENNSDRFAKLGLFIGGAPQTPGLSEAKRTAQATEGMLKEIKKLTQPGPLLNTGPMASFA